MLKIAYIAGPFRGPTPWDVECNVRRAEALALEVARLGVFPFCPHANTRFFDGQCTDTLWLEGDKELLGRCDCLVLTGDYSRSKGAMAELDLANSLMLPIFHCSELAALKEWAGTCR